LIFSIVEFESAKLQNNYEIGGMNEEKKWKKDCSTSFLYGGRLQNALTQHTIKVTDFQSNQLWQGVGE